jgi:hypothetical protein
MEQKRSLLSDTHGHSLRKSYSRTDTQRFGWVMKMVENRRVVPTEAAAHEVEVAITRLALLHLAFSKILVKEFGERKGKQLIIKSILEYGKRIGERIKRGLPDLPKYGLYKEWKDGRLYGCVLARVFREYGEEDLGCLYCYVDPAKSMAIDPENKVIHKDCAACGDDYCTFEQGPTTKKEKADFESGARDWGKVDPRLVQGIRPKKEQSQ